MPNKAIIAAAGSSKTQHIIDSSLGTAEERSLVLSFTEENQKQIVDRLRIGRGDSQAVVRVMGWMKFLLSEAVMPYQRAITGVAFFVRGMDFDGEPVRGVRADVPPYFLTKQGLVYGRNLAHLVVRLDELTEGAVVRRLEQAYDHIYIDEAQDLVGWDLEVLELLFRSRLDVTLVADPRQHTYATNRGNKNQQYRGDGIVQWFEEQHELLEIETRVENSRCPQSICDYADALYPELPRSVSVCPDPGEHHGIHFITQAEVPQYFDDHQPTVLRDNRRSNVMDLSAMNMGQSKGRAFDHVLIFPTQPIRDYLKSSDPSGLKERTRARLYVAITRARKSVAFVTDT